MILVLFIQIICRHDSHLCTHINSSRMRTVLCPSGTLLALFIENRNLNLKSCEKAKHIASRLIAVQYILTVTM